MIVARRKIQKLTVGRVLSVCLMLFCLCYLTSLNYFLHSGKAQGAEQMIPEETTADFPPSGIPEEKSGGSAFSFGEEILHENHPDFNFLPAGMFASFHMAGADSFSLFHPELILPPPKGMA